MDFKEKEDNLGSEEDFSMLKNVMNHLGRGRKRTTDTREFLQLVSLFRILEPLKTKPLPVIRSFIKDVGKHLFHEGQHIDANTISHPLQYTWLVIQGKVSLHNCNSNTDINQSVTLSEGDCFSNHLCHCKEYLNQPQHYRDFSAKAKTSCVLVSIQNTKLNKLFQFDEVQQQLQKRTLICRALSLHTSGHTIKSFVKRFLLRKLNKSTVLVHQDHREDTFFVISKGNVELTKNCHNQCGQKIKIRIGIVTQNSFINDYSFFKSSQICLSMYTVQSMTELEVYALSKHQLYKYFYDLPTLWPNISFMCDQKHLVRQHSITKHLQKRQLIQSQQSLKNVVYPLFKKATLGFRKQIPSGNEDFIMDPIKYQQLVNNKEKIVKPLMEKKQNSRNKRGYQIQIQELKKIMKKEKMDIMKVKSLVDNRIRGIRSDDVIIQLKPTLFNDRIKQEDIQQIESLAITPCVLSSRIKGKVKQEDITIRNSNENIRQTTYDKPRASTAKIHRIRNFKMVAPPRQYYQSCINKSSDPYILTRCQTGKTRKVRVVM